MGLYLCPCSGCTVSRKINPYTGVLYVFPPIGKRYCTPPLPSLAAGVVSLLPLGVGETPLQLRGARFGTASGVGNG
jgi:hypothetical protein